MPDQRCCCREVLGFCLVRVPAVLDDSPDVIVWDVKTSGIRIPLLCVNAEDDPMVPPRLFNIGTNRALKKFFHQHLKRSQQRHQCNVGRRLASENSNVVHVLTRFGSHLGYFKRGWWWLNCERDFLVFASLCFEFTF